jgi:hypothetical protein
MARLDVPLPQVLPTPRGLGETRRRDTWWLYPLVTFLVFASFIVYATWAAFQGTHYHFAGGGAQYLSPMYSPEIFGSSPHAFFGPKPDWLPWPGFLPFSPALLILWAPGGFRFTCYYYRGAYYKAFWADPISCAVGEPGFRGKKYRGEAKFPLILQNVHRYFLYIAVAFIFFLGYDAWHGFWFTEVPGDPHSPKHLGVAVGSFVLLMNAVLLGMYTLSCHSMRHIVGGVIDRLSGHPVRKKMYDCVTCLNRRHMVYAWVSLFWVAGTDVYVRLCSSGVIHDYRLL